jgi:GAF domain-containing protein/CheY-like chemotaxis protein
VVTIASGQSAGGLRVGLVGGGRGGTALLDLLLDWSDGRVTVVIDPRQDAPAIERARVLGIPTAAHHLDVFAHPVDVVLEVTGQQPVLEELLQARPSGAEVIGAGSLRFFWTLLQGQVKAARQLRLQLDMATVFESAADPKEQVAIATQKLAEACGVDRCAFLLLDETSGLVLPVMSQFATGQSNERMRTAFKDLGSLRRAELPFFAAVMERRSPIEIDDPATSPLLPAGWAALFEIGSLLVLPIFCKDQVVGACLLDHWRVPRPFTPEQIRLATTLAGQVSLAVENTRLYTRLEERAEKLTALNALSELIVSTRDVRQVFQEITKAATALLGARVAHVWVDDPAERALRPQAASGLAPGEERLVEFEAIPYGKGVAGCVFESGRAEYVTDAQADPRFLNRRLNVTLGLHACAVIPLMTGDQVAGVLSLLYTSPRVFTPEEKEVMALLAGQAAVALTNARLFEESERRRRVAESLAETGRRIARSLDPEQCGQWIADSLRGLVGIQYSALFRVEPESGDLVAVAVSGDDGPTFRPNMVVPQGTGMAALAVSERQPVATADLLTDPRIALPPGARARMEAEPYRAVLAVPLIVQDGVLGVLVVRDRAGRVFTTEEIHLVQTFADQAAVALENARLYAEATRRQRQAENLARLAQVITAPLELPEVLESVARAATDLLPDAASRIWVLEVERLVLRSEAGTRGAPRSGQKTELAVGEGLTGYVALTRQALVVEDVLTDSRTVNAEWMRQEGYVSLLCVPLQIQGRLVGVLSLLTRHHHRFSTAELQSLTSFGNQAAIAIEHAKLLQELRARQSRLETLHALSCELSRMQPLESLLMRIAEACGILLGTDSVGFRLLEGDDLVVTGTWGQAAEALPTLRLKVGESLSGIVAATGEPLMVSDPASDSRLLPAHREAWRRLGFRAYLGVPVKIGARVVGVLSIQTRRAEEFSSEDLTAATAFASQAAVALENSRLLQETRRAYEELAQTQGQLTQAQRMEAVGQLAGGIAHDFNNLLTVIMGRSELLLNCLKPADPIRQGIELVQKAAGRAVDLTRQLLAFSRKQVLQPTSLDLNGIITNLEQMLRRVIGEDISLVTTLDPALGHVRADPSQIEQVIMNLVVNARDAMPQGGRLSIETSHVDLDAAYVQRHAGAHPGPHVRLAVGDTGVGMPSEVQAHIFEPFFTTKDPGQGTGLGLATVYGIVKQSEGYIEVDTEPGRGTTFRIYLPRVDEAPAPARPTAALTQVPHGTETILLVEDEEEVRTLARDVLRANGYTVLDTPHGGEALLACERHAGPIELLMTDVVMPQMSGRELAERLAPLRPEMKVLYMSGYTDDAVVRHGVLSLGTAFLQKPFMPNTVARKVREVLDAPDPRPTRGDVIP